MAGIPFSFSEPGPPPNPNGSENFAKNMGDIAGFYNDDGSHVTLKENKDSQTLDVDVEPEERNKTK
ncbi:hypothetical protein MMC20_004761 [Loxospora ochrophaea]|nr:hypothetical protein [Loxospora ochrophaea]